MLDDKNYKYYQILKQKLIFLNDGIDFSKVLAHDIARVAFNQSDSVVFREILYNFSSEIDFTDLRRAMENNRFVCLYSVDRSDYSHQIAQTFQGIEKYEAVLLGKLPRNKTFKPFRILKAIFFTLFKVGLGQENLSNIFFLASKIVSYKNSQESLKKQFKGFDYSDKTYVSFNSAYTFESLITQFFNIAQCPTVSLSHSFFVNYKKFIPLDIINAECITAQKLLVWGETSKHDLKVTHKVPENIIEIAGNPKYDKKSIRLKNTFKRCVVLLGRKIYEDTNIDIVKILKDFLSIEPNVQFELKLHLSLDKTFYEGLCEGSSITVIDGKESLVELFENKGYDFSIVNNSTAYYEALYYDLICFRFLPAENEAFVGMDDHFSDANTLLERINFFKQADLTQLNTNLEQLLKDTIGMGVNRYKEILEA
ncbi:MULTISPECIES: hypothetical protein [unclassified Arcicella]|uniref:hypothetical protein n=1 Tax=unclassified Arcicella TaxID=2644986 RepID=UPI0028549F9C|nr:MULTISPECIES: hypothetical protein [unclassified Arcicella]MDR6564801.1 hypothetical protein [Arcicella sp. BE51]MDR6814597.1 hypothetical protein [Arcicella sp. BE140]MDR6825975.1 hypothetical protein [Arcicella sp. BE139]